MNALGENALDVDAFREAAQSLKLYRRADIPGASGESLIEQLYVDPLPNDHVLNTMVKPNTTFIIGRKGTGKSTVFLRAQHELRNNDNAASAYVDIKTVYESSQVDPNLLSKASDLEGSLSASEIERLLLYRQFLSTLIGEIRSELEKRIKSSRRSFLRRRTGGATSRRKPIATRAAMASIFSELDALLAKAHGDRFINILGTVQQQASSRTKADEAVTAKVAASLKASPQAGAGLSAESSATYGTSTERERQYAEVLMRVFDIREYIAQLTVVLEKVSPVLR